MCVRVSTRMIKKIWDVRKRLTDHRKEVWATQKERVAFANHFGLNNSEKEEGRVEEFIKIKYWNVVIKLLTILEP